jgi:glycerol-3-phosphate dehydrogenase subunit B
MHDIKTIETDLMVIGCGMAGMAAALFAGRRGMETVQVGITGQINFASGLLDLLGVHPVDRGTRLHNPWTGIEQLVRDDPRHPYGLMSTCQIETAMAQCLSFLKRAGLPYQTNGRRNANLVTPLGTVKTTYAVPQSMFAGVTARSAKTPTLLVDFWGLKGFSARQIMETFGDAWPMQRTRIPFPGMNGELYTEHAARTLEVAANRIALADAVRPHLGTAHVVGLPAVLGIYRTQDIIADLEKRLGVPVFEIPTMVPSITGLRLREAFEQQLPRMGVRAYYQKKVLEAEVLPNGGFQFLVGGHLPEMRVRSHKAILASGRFFGKGLHATRLRIQETIFNLPVEQSAERDHWYHKDWLNARGHAINRAGINVDDHFRPTDANGNVIHDRLYAAGSILAHQDWVRQKCGSGLAIATAYGAVAAAAASPPKPSAA